MAKIILTEEQFIKYKEYLKENIENEIRSVIDYSFNDLCKWIYDTVSKKYSIHKYFFEINVPQNILDKCNKYGNIPNLIIKSEFMPYGKMEFKNNLLILDIANFMENNRETVESQIFHELTHLVNNQNFEIKPIYLSNDDEDIKRVFYLFRDTERNARVNELYKILTTTKNHKNLENYESITHLEEMSNLLNKVQDNISFRKKVFDEYRENNLKINVNILNKWYSIYKKKINKVYKDYSDISK